MDSKHLRARVGGGVVGYSGDTSVHEGVGECRNLLLSETMRELNWSSSKLAAAVNSILGEGFIGPSREDALSWYERTVRSMTPQFDARPYLSTNGKWINDATLFLPLSDDGETVNRVLVFTESTPNTRRRG